jgi:hypothetical protein
MVPFEGLRMRFIMQRGRWGAASFLIAERPGVRGMGKPLNVLLRYGRTDQTQIST